MGPVISVMEEKELSAKIPSISVLTESLNALYALGREASGVAPALLNG